MSEFYKYWKKPNKTRKFSNSKYQHSQKRIENNNLSVWNQVRIWEVVILEGGGGVWKKMTFFIYTIIYIYTDFKNIWQSLYYQSITFSFIKTQTYNFFRTNWNLVMNAKLNSHCSSPKPPTDTPLSEIAPYSSLYLLN